MLALHVGLAVGGLGQREWLAEHRLVLDVPHQTAARIRHGALVHQLHVQNQHNIKSSVLNETQQKHGGGFFRSTFHYENDWSI